MHVEHQDRELREIENTMMQHTYSDIMSLEPCFDPAERGYCTRDWQGTALDVLRHPNVTAQDKLWLVLREDWIPAPVLHEFACRCAERALALVDTPDPRSVEAIATKRAWLRGEATDDELAAAQDAALAAAQDAVLAAVQAAAWDAAQAAARAAQDAAWAARDAARSAAWAAAQDAAWAAWAAAWDAAWDTAWDAARAAQVDLLIALLAPVEA